MSSKESLTLKIITPEGIILKKNDLYSVNVQLSDGYPIGIRPGHAPLIAETEKGTIRFHSEVFQDEVHLHAGVLDIRDNVITVLTAGEVEKIPRSMAESGESEYDRLMKTLINQIQIEDETEQEIE